MDLKSIEHRLEPAHRWDIIGDFLMRAVAVFFIVVAILTTLEFLSFIMLIEKSLRVNTTLAYILGAIVIFFELISGLLIYFRKQIIISVISLLCIIGFLLLLSILEIFLKQQGGNVSLGLFRYVFSDMQIFFIQLFAINIIILFGFSTCETGILSSKNILLVTILVLGYLNFGLIRSYLKLSTEITNHPYNLVNQIERYIPNTLPRQASSIVVFLLQHSDFNCPPCLESLNNLSEELHSSLRSTNKKANVITLIREDAVLFNQHRVDYWKKANEFPFDALFVPDSIFRKLNIEKSCALVIQKQNNVVFYENLPLSKREIKTILNFIN